MKPLRSGLVLVVLGVALLQAAWILAVPPFAGIDEFDHVYRAAAVARGEGVSHGEADDGRGGLVTVPPDVVEAAHHQCAALPYVGHDNCNAAERLTDGSVRIASGASRYNPALYWYLGTVARPFSGAAADYAMRVAGATLCLLGVAACLWLLARRRNIVWARLGLLLAVSPVVVYSTVLPAGNGPEIVAGLVVWCGLLSLGERRTPGDAWVVTLTALAAIALVTFRSLGPVFLVLVVASVGVARGRSAGAIVRAHRRGLTLATAFTVLAGVASVSWVLLQDPLTGDGSSVHARAPWSSLGQVPLLNLLQTIDAAPSRNQHGPLFLYPIYLAALSMLLVLALRTVGGARRRGLVIAVVTTQLLPLAISAAALRSLGLIWQGRYALAFTAGVVVLAGVLLDEGGHRRLPRGVMAAWVAVVGLTQVAAVVAVVHGQLESAVSAADPNWVRSPSAVVAALAVSGCLLLGWAVDRDATTTTTTSVVPPEIGVRDEGGVVVTDAGRERAADGWPWRPS